MKVLLLLISLSSSLSYMCWGLIPLIDGGKGMPKLYNAYFDDQIAKQASAAISRAISAGNRNMEVQFPPVPNVEEAKFGTPLNQKFGTAIVARDLKISGGYKPGSNISRNLIAYSNLYWAKKLAGSVKGGALGGNPVGVITAEQVNFDEVGNFGDVSRTGVIFQEKARKGGRNNEAIIAINPGGEETWDRLVSAHGQPNCPFVVMNNAYSTSYDLGNRKGFEEVYYLKRISRGFVFRSFPGNWEALLEKPDGSVEVLKSYKTKPSLREVSELVRDESFKRYAINNDRWMSGRM
ncbi:hypothetical protein ACHAXH_000626 [Discostella pseudostelligera]